MKNLVLLLVFSLLLWGESVRCQTVSDDFVITFNDKVLESRIRHILNKFQDSIQYRDVKHLTRIDIVYSANGDSIVYDLSPFQYFDSLRILFIYSQAVRDLSPLAKLSNLEYLGLYGNRISNLKPLANLITLKTLYLSNNQINDISSLVKLKNLETLDIGMNSIDDIGVLAKLPRLRSLILINNTDITNIDTLEYLTPRIETLNVSGCDIKSLRFVHGFKGLKYLTASNNQIESLEPLFGLRNISTLDVSGNKIKDLNPLKKLFNDGCFYGKVFSNGVHITLSRNPYSMGGNNADIITFLKDNNVKIRL
jgi:internalin A